MVIDHGVVTVDGAAHDPQWRTAAPSSSSRSLRPGYRRSAVVITTCAYCLSTTVELVAHEAHVRLDHRSTHCSSPIPVVISDDKVYRTLPAVGVATVDKLATIAFKPHVSHLTHVFSAAPLSLGVTLEPSAGESTRNSSSTTGSTTAPPTSPGDHRPMRMTASFDPFMIDTVNINQARPNNLDVSAPAIFDAPSRYRDRLDGPRLRAPELLAARDHHQAV